MAAYLSWSVEILVTNVIETMRWSESKQLAGYIFGRCIAPAPILSLLTGFCGTEPIGSVTMLVSKYRGGVLGNMAVLNTSSGPYANIWVGEAEGATDVSWYYLHVDGIAPLFSFEHVPSQITDAVRLLGCLG